MNAVGAVGLVGLALGMRHGRDPDHLAAIDGLTRLRPRATNGVYFALGHGLVSSARDGNWTIPGRTSPEICPQLYT
jgi:high-affinity nickel permease